MFGKGVWLIIAGVLLLGPTPGLADSYLRVRKKGVIYYYFNSRKSPSAKQGGKQAEIRPGVPAGPLTTSWEGAALSPGPSLYQTLPGAETDLQAVQPPEVNKPIRTGARYLTSLLTKLGYCSPLALFADRPLAPQPEPWQNVPSLNQLAALVAESCDNFLPQARKPGPASGPMNFGPVGGSPFLYCFPVGGPHSFHDGFLDYRSGGRLHHAIDIFAQEGTPVYAITAGVIHTLAFFPGAGITLLMEGRDGRGYGYMHLHGYAPGMVEGRAVRTGELLGYVGHTGTRNSPAHLHFQVYADHRLSRDNLLNPYNLLVQLCHGVGVTDLYHHCLAYLPQPPANVSRIQVYRHRLPTMHLGRSGQRTSKDILVIRNY